MPNTTTATKTVRTVVASTSVAAAGTARGTLDLRTAFGGFLTLKITNGATGPTAQCNCNVLVAHNAGSTPAAGAAGTDWKTIYTFGGGTTNSLITEQSMVIDPSIMHIEVEFTGHTAQAVTVEAILSELTNTSTT